MNVSKALVALHYMGRTAAINNSQHPTGRKRVVPIDDGANGSHEGRSRPILRFLPLFSALRMLPANALRSPKYPGNRLAESRVVFILS